jgi:hypothetical protein
MTPEVMSKIAIWRQKALDNTLTEAEMVEAIQTIRGDRRSAAHASDASRKKTATKVIPSADDLLNELGGL